MLQHAGLPGETIEIVATLETQGAEVAGTQNDIELLPPLSFARRANGGPDCNVESTIGKDHSLFAFTACATEGCERVRALVLSFSDVDPIPDGSLLYRCRVIVDDAAESGAHPLRVVAAGASDPEGNALPAFGIPGSVFVGGLVQGEAILGDVTVASGAIALVPVSLASDTVKMLTIELRYGSETPPLIGDGNGPSCATVVSDADASFSFLPLGCSPDDGTCTAVRAQVTATGTALPAGEPLFTCSFRPRATLDPGTYAIGCGGGFAIDVGGHGGLVACNAARVGVIDDLTMPTPTPTSTDETPVRATFTATPQLQLTTTPARASDGDDSCAVVSTRDQSPARALLWPLAAWWLVRRRIGRRGAEGATAK